MLTRRPVTPPAVIEEYERERVRLSALIDRGVEALRAVAFHRAHGTTTTLASLVAAAPEELRRSVDVLAELVVDGEIAGVHLEGPWLAAARCGAHDPAQLRDPHC